MAGGSAAPQDTLLLVAGMMFGTAAILGMQGAVLVVTIGPALQASRMRASEALRIVG